jgi:hypothetical protein
VQAFLVPVHHRLPVEAAGVGEAVAVAEAREVDGVEEGFEVWVEAFEGWAVRGEGAEEEAGGGEVGGEGG